MPRALRTPKFGAWLHKQRGRKTLEEFAIQVRHHAAPMGLEFDRSQIKKLEAGRLPSVPIMQALAPVLDLAPQDIQARIIAELRGEPYRVASAEDAHEKKSHGVTSPDMGVGVQGSHATVEIPHLPVAGGDRLDPDPSRVSEFDAAAEAVVAENIRIVLRERSELQELIDRLRASADDVRAVADILQLSPTNEGTRTKRPADAGRAKAHPRRKAKR